jgi:uncharacterized Fe-S cluster-containing radical SAM superfamily protein
MDEYFRFVTPSTKPFDPVELLKQTEKIVCDGDRRKYTDFYATGVYGGIATGYTVGCMLRCIFCWVSKSREYPEKYGQFYSTRETFEILKEVARRYGVRKMRISGGEPTIGKKHLLGLLNLIQRENIFFILETNGIYFGIDKEYARDVSKFHNIHIRVSIKAGNPDSFEKKTGAKKEAFELPFEGIRNLLAYGASFHVASMSLDPRIITQEERLSLARKLLEIDRRLLLQLEEEVVDPYDTTIIRLNAANYEMKFPLQKIYVPIKQLLR